MFSTLIDDVGVSTGNDKPLSNAGDYNIRYDGGPVECDYLTQEGILGVGDVNGDSLSDLVVGSKNANFGGEYSGSVFVIFGGASIGSGDKPLNVPSNFNIR
jgi:hypothetical protein